METQFAETRVLTMDEYKAALAEKVEDPQLLSLIANPAPMVQQDVYTPDGTTISYFYVQENFASASQPWKDPYDIGWILKTPATPGAPFVTNVELWVFDDCPAFRFRTLAQTVHTTLDTCKHVNALLQQNNAWLQANSSTLPFVDKVTLVRLSDDFKQKQLSLSKNDQLAAFIEVIDGPKTAPAPIKAKRKSKEKTTISTTGTTVFLPRLKKIYDYTCSFLQGESLLSKTQLGAMFFVGPAGTGKTQVANTVVHDITERGLAHVEELAGVSIDPNKYAEYLLGADTMEEATVKFQPGILLRGLQATMNEEKDNLVVLIHEFNRSTGLIHLDAILRSIGDTGYIQFNSQAENMPDVIQHLAPLPIDYIGGSLYRVDLNKIDKHVRFLLTGNMGTEYQVQEIPTALRGRLAFMNFPNYTPTEMEEIFNASPNFANLGEQEKRMTLSTYSLFCNLLNNAQITELPRITEILAVVDFAFIDPTLAAENLRAQLGEENLPENTFDDLITLFSGKGEEQQEVEA